MSKIPEGVKKNTLEFIFSSDIPKEDQVLFDKWFSMAYMGPLWEGNKMRLIPVVFVESFYSEFLPFYNANVLKQ